MNLLADFADRHPVTTSVFGTAGGAASVALSALHAAGDVATDIGRIAGAACAVLTLILLYGRWCDRRIRHEAARWREHDDLP